jgi:hypothetical protein
MFQYHGNNECQCVICRLKREGLTDEQIEQHQRQWEQEALEKQGWFGHYCNDERYPTGANYHTHGLPATMNHMDLQLVVPLDMKTAHGIFTGVVDLIKEGKVFHDGDTADKVVRGYRVKFIEMTEGERQVLRIILPDQRGNLEQWEIEGNLALQYEPFLDTEA